MFATSTILVVLAIAAISGISGYMLSYRFNASNYAATNRSGDFGSPRGGFFAMLSGTLIGMLVVNLGSYLLPGIAAEAAGAGFITAMVVGAVAGVTGMIHGQNFRRSQTKTDDTKPVDENKDEPKN